MDLLYISAQMERSVYKASFIELNRQRMGDGVDETGGKIDDF